MTRSEARKTYDAFRTTFTGGRVQMSRGFYDLPAQVKGKLLWHIAQYDAFDPNGYHDAGVIIFGDWSVYWHIEERPELVLDIMLGEELN